MDKTSLGQRFGGAGTHIANIITVLTTNWGVSVSVGMGLIGALWASALGFFQHPAVQIGIGVFLATLWTIAGVTYLIDRTRARVVRISPDYRYGLTFEGIMPSVLPHREDAWLTMGVQIRNFSQSPIRYAVERFEIKIGTRSLPPRSQSRPNRGYLARGAGKIAGAPSFKKDDLREFFGQNDVIGTAECAIVYGHPEQAPVRRLTIKAELHLDFTSGDGPPLGFGADILEEIDEPYTEPPPAVRRW